MLKNDKKLIVYLESLVNSVFKILPLYEEKNIGIEKYVESLLFELYGLEDAVEIKYSYEYISLLSTLESVNKEIGSQDSKKSVVKREIFKCINIIKNMIGKLKEGE
ncbi:hypothetical protein [Bacillus mojavensis]